MSHPTYDEFKHTHVNSEETGYIIKTGEGRLYLLENSKFIQRAEKAIRYLFYVAFVTVILFVSISDKQWPMLRIDKVLVPILLAPLTSRLLYRRARFRELEPGSAEYETLKNKNFGQPPGRLQFILLGLLFLLLFLNSFTFTYLKSLIYQEAQITSVQVNSEEFDPRTGDAPAVFRVSDTGDDYHLRVTTICVPEKATVTADGEPTWGYRIPYFSFFWQADYFSQQQDFFIERSLIRDGSVVTFECGDLTREWVFDLPD